MRNHWVWMASVLWGCLAMSLAPAWAQTTSAGNGSGGAVTTSAKLTTEYAELAGSMENSRSLVNGLQSGREVNLIASAGLLSVITPSASFTPATGKLGLGEVNIALSLAKAALAQQGITHPTPSQMAAALNGGTFATTGDPVTMVGVLSQRKAGQGWGQIAHAMGFKLGALVSASKTEKNRQKNQHVAEHAVSAQSEDSKSLNQRGKSGVSQSNHSGGSGHGASSSKK